MLKHAVKTMNNIRLKHKLLILVLLCVLIPLIVTNSGILWSMRQGLKKEQEQKRQNVVDRLESELRERINQQLTIADYLNRNEKLKRFLNRSYQSPSEYYLHREQHHCKRHLFCESGRRQSQQLVPLVHCLFQPSRPLPLF